jgi:uncharacterized protein
MNNKCTKDRAAADTYFSAIYRYLLTLVFNRASQEILGGLVIILALLANVLLLVASKKMDIAVVAMAIFIAASISSVVGFAFSAICGALLFYLISNQIFVVKIMIICSISIQLLSVAALWKMIDWQSLPAFFAGGILGVPVGIYLLLHLPGYTYKDFIGALLVPLLYAADFV